MTTSISIRKVCFISDKHIMQDDRIYWKEAISLTKAGYLVTHLGIGSCNNDYITGNGIRLIEIKKKIFFQNPYLDKLFRLFFKGRGHNQQLFEIASQLQADVYHIHDLKPVALTSKLKKLNSKPKVVYCIRESYPDMVRDYHRKSGMFKFLIALYSQYVDFFERWHAKKADFVITIDDAMYIKYINITGVKKTDILYNFADNIPEKIKPFSERQYDLLYLGGIAEVRGIMQILEAVKICRDRGVYVRTILLGPVYELTFEICIKNYLSTNGLEEMVKLLPRVPYNEVHHYLSDSRIGIVTLLPIPKFQKNIPIKQFEYMAFGMPVIGSPLPPIEPFIKKVNSGIIVDPEKPEVIASAITELLSDREKYELLSRNGREAAEKEYNWKFMEEKLIRIYSELPRQ